MGLNFKEALEGFTPAKPVSKERVEEIGTRYNRQITDFYKAIVELVEKKDPEGAEIMLRIVSGMLLTLPKEIEQEQPDWFSKHIGKA